MFAVASANEDADTAPVTEWPPRLGGGVAELNPLGPEHQAVPSGPGARQVAGVRRRLQLILGTIWVLVGALQFQPFMFGRSFVQALEAATAGQAQWIKSTVHWALSDVAVRHLDVYDALWASIQLLIGLAILYPRTTKVGLAASIPWAVGVWWFGEGFGGLWGGTMPVMGYPGAVMIYALIALLVWPRDHRPDDAAPTVAAAGLLGPTGSRVVWTILWLGAARFQLLTANRSPSALGSMVVGMGPGEPQWVKDVDHLLGADVLANHGTEFSIGLALLFTFSALAIYSPRTARAAVVVTICLAVFIWFLEDFGTIFSSEGTDPNSGLLLALLSLCYWPLRQPRRVRILEGVRTAP